MTKHYKKVLFAGGCFWCIEAAMRSKAGVIDVVSGYAGENVQDASYEKVGAGRVKAREAVRITYDPAKLSYEDLVRHFFSKIDPTDAGGQFADRGYQYTTCIYHKNEEEKNIAERVIEELNVSGKYEKPIVTTIEPETDFKEAEEYHQRYSEKNPGQYDSYRRGSGRADYEMEMKMKHSDKG